VAGGVLYTSILLVNCHMHLNFMFAHSGGINSLCNHIAGILTQFHSAYNAYVIYFVFLWLRIISNLCVGCFILVCVLIFINNLRYERGKRHHNFLYIVIWFVSVFFSSVIYKFCVVFFYLVTWRNISLLFLFVFLCVCCHLFFSFVLFKIIFIFVRVCMCLICYY
jgi:hypothetical protein